METRKLPYDINIFKERLTASAIILKKIKLKSQSDPIAKTKFAEVLKIFKKGKVIFSAVIKNKF